MTGCAKRSIHLFSLVAGLLLTVNAWSQSPFKVSSRLERADDGKPPRLVVTFAIPSGHYLYEQMTEIRLLKPDGAKLKLLQAPEAERKYDKTLEQEVGTFHRKATFVYAVTGLNDRPLRIEVAYQGCNQSTCFIPQTETFVLSPGKSGAKSETDIAAPNAPPSPGEDAWRALADRFTVSRRGAGYLAAPEFIEFLETKHPAGKHEKNFLQRVVDRYGLLVAMLLIIPLGLLLNLTPCVLPMIPINLAIIGAGAQAHSKKRGFLLGGTYGAGMALVYGILGLFVVITGSRFGALNSSPWFNLGIALVFVALGLAMFDVFFIDFSRLQRGGTPGAGPAGRPAFVTAFLLGGMAALLAGACVAPVLIWVLVLSIDLYSSGKAAVGLLLPFLLGVGMALPWPFAGAGMSFLPKPGGWMNRVKHVFGGLIFLAAAYYAHQAYVLHRADLRPAASTTVAVTAEDAWLTSLEDGLRLGLAENKPVFLDFWALSCKSCMKMKRTTFKDPAVKQLLDTYIRVAFQADDADSPRVRNVLRYYHILGLPTYLVLEAKTASGGPPPKSAPEPAR